MRQRAPILNLRGVLVLLLGAGALWFGLSQLGSTHRGQAVGYWVAQYYEAETPQELEASYDGIRALRREALPILAKEAVESTKPSRMAMVRGILSQWLASFGFHWKLINQEDRKDRARFALKTLATDAGELVPMATRFYHRNRSVDDRTKAMSLLRFVVRGQEACTPLLIRAYGDHDLAIGAAASDFANTAFRTKTTHPPAELLPALIDFIAYHNVEFDPLYSSYALLGRYGPAASNSVPIILARFRSTTNSRGKLALAAVLMSVDPDATEAPAYLLNALGSAELNLLDQAPSTLEYFGHRPELRPRPFLEPLGNVLWAKLQAGDLGPEQNLAIIRLLVELRYRPEALLPYLHTDLANIDIPNYRNRPTSGLFLADLFRLSTLVNILSLDPNDQSAWAVYDHLLSRDLGSAQSNMNKLIACNAIFSLRAIPIPIAEKQRRRRELLSLYDGTNPWHPGLRRVLFMELAEIDPTAWPTNFQELVDVAYPPRAM